MGFIVEFSRDGIAALGVSLDFVAAGMAAGVNRSELSFQGLGRWVVDRLQRVIYGEALCDCWLTCARSQSGRGDVVRLWEVQV